MTASTRTPDTADDRHRPRAGDRVDEKAPNVAPQCFNRPGMSDDGFEELCHIVTDADPDTALCGKDVTGYPWNPPWPVCQACAEMADGRQN